MKYTYLANVINALITAAGQYLPSKVFVNTCRSMGGIVNLVI